MIENMLSRLQGVRKSGRGYMAKCPAHNDSSPSLSLSETPDGRILLKCFAGCPASSVVDSIGLTMGDLFPDGPIRDYLPSAVSRAERSRREHEELIIAWALAQKRQGKRISEDHAKRVRLAQQRLKTLCTVD